MKKLLLFAALIISAASFAQVTNYEGAPNMILYNPGMSRMDNVFALPDKDSAQTKAAFPTARMKGRMGMQNDRPFVLKSTNVTFLFAGFREMTDSLAAVRLRLEQKQNALGYTAENTADKIDVITGNSATKYVSERAAATALATKPSWIDTTNTIVTNADLNTAIATIPIDTSIYLGVIYSANSWANTNDFTVSNCSTAIVSNKIVVTPNTTGDYGATLSLPTPSMLENYRIDLRFKVNAITASSYGVGIGKASVNSFLNASVLAHIGFITGGTTAGVDMLGNNGTGSYTTTISTRAGVTASAGDYVHVSIARQGYDYFITARNVTANQAQVDTIFNINGSGKYGDNTGRYSIYFFGGTYTIDSFAVSSKELKYADLLTIGDSKYAGANATSYEKDFGVLLRNNYRSVVKNAGGGDRSTEVLQRVSEIIALRPKAVLLGIGSNDPRSGVSQATFKANYQAISDSLTNHGIPVYYPTPLYETSQDLTWQKDWVMSTFPSSKIVDVWTPMTLAGSVDVDGVHPTNLGHYRVYQAIISSNKIRGAKQTGITYTGKETYVNPPIVDSTLYATRYYAQSLLSSNVDSIPVYNHDPTETNLYINSTNKQLRWKYGGKWFWSSAADSSTVTFATWGQLSNTTNAGSGVLNGNNTTTPAGATATQTFNQYVEYNVGTLSNSAALVMVLTTSNDANYTWASNSNPSIAGVFQNGGTINALTGTNTNGPNVGTSPSTISANGWIRFERSGNNLLIRTSPDGTTYTTAYTYTNLLAGLGPIYIKLIHAANSSSKTTTTRGIF